MPPAARSVRRIPFYDMAAIAPAGGINSSVADMLAYLEVSFALDETGAIVRLAIPFDRDVADIVFLLATPDR
mgnify:CR=1 FL=1